MTATMPCMSTLTSENRLTLESIPALLNRNGRVDIPENGRSRASVAMILGSTPAGMAMFFIERARDERDPWSGNLAFPGGRVEPGEQLQEAALRETWEEIGLDLALSAPLGRLPDIVGANLPVHVSCFAYGFSVIPRDIRPNHEVSDAFWVNLADLLDQRRHITTVVLFGERRIMAPAIQLPQREHPVLWGITYRLVMQFLELLPEPCRPGLHFPPDGVHFHGDIIINGGTP